MFFKKNKQWLWKLITKQSVRKGFVTVEIIKIDLFKCYHISQYLWLSCYASLFRNPLFYPWRSSSARGGDFLTARAREWCVRVLIDFRKGKENNLYVQAIIMLIA